ncbi:TetR/AcrR family transcriptional regulator [Streptomyces indicus]|uniref:DNA-binding transcriptional regulator, AcrR family n=1 Tax=Streptomyces indicus TaxID=417292 RepID=A0A1G9H1F6_9ACTN|nr:TetR/AcrR family transcriptional regulator [Streptomyces indicus]SDL06709.1 DNA-binding transcriptional regulator, AcrR family [Streptomyces indicus]
MATAAAPAERSRRVVRPRADALRNRERIVAAAREMFVEFGPEVPFDEIARRAGVGNATLYRHFADRAELIREVVCSVMDRTSEQAELALAEEGDAFGALRRFVHAAAEERIGALCPMLSGDFDKEHPDLDEARDRLEGLVEQLMARARTAGQLRTDVAVGDLMVALSQLTRPLPGSGCVNFDQFVHRHLQLFLDGLQAPARSELPGTAATLEDLRQKACKA